MTDRLRRLSMVGSVRERTWGRGVDRKVASRRVKWSACLGKVEWTGGMTVFFGRGECRAGRRTFTCVC